jgi:hypothetical protein
MRTVLLLLAMLAMPLLASAQSVWKWVDEQGVTHYSDRPMPGATRVELSVGRTGTVAPSPPPPSRSTRRTDRDGPTYETLAITTPSQGESIVNTGGLVQVNVQLVPSLRTGHNLQVYFDGQLLEGSFPNATSYSLMEVPRGEHTLQAVVTDSRGARVQSSDSITFYVQQTSIANPPVGPALRNPPRPRASNKLRTQQPSYADLGGRRTAKVDPRTNRPPTKP